MTNNNLVPSTSEHVCLANCNQGKCDENNELLIKMMFELDKFTKLTSFCLMICKSVEETVSELKKEVEGIKDAQRWTIDHR